MTLQNFSSCVLCSPSSDVAPPSNKTLHSSWGELSHRESSQNLSVQQRASPVHLQQRLWQVPNWMMVLSRRNWEHRVPPSPAVQLYLDHLDEVAAANPTLLLAHAYTQYMALCAGGSIIRRMLQRSMKLPDRLGTASLTFKVSYASTCHAHFLDISDHRNAMVGLHCLCRDPAKAQLRACSCRTMRAASSADCGML